MADANVTQADLSGGIFRGRRAPETAVYDAANTLVDDEAQLFRRGGTGYHGTAASDTLHTVADMRLHGGQRTMGLLDTGQLVVFATDDATPATVSWGTAQPTVQRLVPVGGYVAARDSLGGIKLYAGSRKADYTAGGTVTATNGSRTITGAGTAFLTNVDKGSIVVLTGETGLVDTVDSDTQLTLRETWAGPTGTVAIAQATAVATPSIDDPFTAITGVGTIARLLICSGSRAWPSTPGMPAIFDLDEYYDVPDGSSITGAATLGDTGILFTDAGLWALSNLSLDTFDDVGNVQQSFEQISTGLVLWGDPGLARWASGLIVPALDDVYVLGRDGGVQPVSEGIREPYREYVEAGYAPGVATVYRGHYLLPVLDGTTHVDTLVCRLDRKAAWTRWGDQAASLSYAARQAGTPKLFGVSEDRFTDLTGCFDPDATRDDDADGTDHQAVIVTRDYDTGPGPRPGHVEQVRLVYELDGTGCTVGVEWASGEEGSAWTACTAIRGGGESDGTDYSVWRVGKARERMRFRITQTGAAASFTLREVELRIRRAGRS